MLSAYEAETIVFCLYDFRIFVVNYIRFAILSAYAIIYVI